MGKGKRVEEMTDTEKAYLDDCPFCGESFNFAWSEVDSDSFCRVTCAGCAQYIEYDMDMVDDSRNQEQEKGGG